MNVHAAQILAACGRVPASQEQLHAQFSRCGSEPFRALRSTGAGRQRDHGWRGHLPERDPVGDPDLGPGQHRRHPYNDSRTAPSCYSGGSYSTDGGVSLTNLNSRPFCTGHGTGFGDPVVVYDQCTRSGSRSSWPPVAVVRASPSGPRPTASRGAPARARTAAVGDDRESGWWTTTRRARSTAGYISWNNFAVGGGAIQVTHRTTAEPPGPHR